VSRRKGESLPREDANLGQEYRVHRRAVLKVLQNSHALDLAGSTMDIELPKLFRICLPSRGERVSAASVS
jgi:hypothetical protein